VQRHVRHRHARERGGRPQRASGAGARPSSARAPWLGAVGVYVRSVEAVMHLKSRSTDLESVATPPLLSPGGALEGGPRRDGWERIRYVLGHPVHLVCLGMLMLMGVFVASPWMLVPILMFEVLVA